MLETVFYIKLHCIHSNAMVFIMSTNFICAFFHTYTALLNGLQESSDSTHKLYFLILHNAVKLWGIKSALTVFHSCFPTCLKSWTSAYVLIRCNDDYQLLWTETWRLFCVRGNKKNGITTKAMSGCY